MIDLDDERTLSKEEEEFHTVSSRKASIAVNPLKHLNDSPVPVESIAAYNIFKAKQNQIPFSPSISYNGLPDNPDYSVKITFSVTHLKSENVDRMYQDLNRWFESYGFKDGFTVK